MEALSRAKLLRAEFLRRSLMPVDQAAAAMGMGRTHLRTLIKRHAVPVVLFPWRDSQVAGVPFRYVKEHRA